MGWLFSSRQSMSSALVAVEDDEEEAPVHTETNPYCGDLKCWCHTDTEYHEEVTDSFLGAEVDDDLYAYAIATLGGR